MGAGAGGSAGTVTRDEFTATGLRAALPKCSDGAQVRRIQALALVLDGHSRSEAAALNEMDRQTLTEAQKAEPGLVPGRGVATLKCWPKASDGQQLPDKYSSTNTIFNIYYET